MGERATGSTRCGIDSVEIARVDRLLRDTPGDDLRRIFSEGELAEAGTGTGRSARLAACFAAKEACLKLFPRETSLGVISAADFAVARNGYGAPRVVCSATAQDVIDRHRMRIIVLSLTHDGTSASAVAVGEPVVTRASLVGKLIYHLLPIRRRIVLANLRRVFRAATDEEITRLAQAHYAHLARVLVEFLRFPFLSSARQAATVRVDNLEAIQRAGAHGKGVLVLTGHFPQYRGRFHVVRRALRPHWLDSLVTQRFRRAGFGVLPKRAALDPILDRLSAGDAVIFILDQHAVGRDGVTVEFFGHPAGTFRSLALIALTTGTPVVPATTWREADGGHVVRFEEALPLVDCNDVDEAIRRNTRAYNAALERFVLRHPEQWFWVHRRWKSAG
jgi:KDO2-lipid IV(A) lauroyltransferase